jgi:low temperature requirement protein LtrA
MKELTLLKMLFHLYWLWQKLLDSLNSKGKKKEIERKVTFALMFFIGMKLHSYPQAA